MEIPVVSAEYRKEIDKARQDLRALILSKTCAPIMLRLAFHDAGTYCKKTKTGGANGSIRKQEEYEQSCNKGLKTAIDLCEEIKSKHPMISYADIYQLAGVLAVEIAGGPVIDFIPGRKDSNECTEEGRLPDLKEGASHLRDKFNRMGLCTKDIIALWGAHILMRAQEDRSDFDGPWTGKPLRFDNSYYTELLKVHMDEWLRWEPWAVELFLLPERLKGEPEGFLLLPSDKLLVTVDGFRSHVIRFAECPKTFLAEYALAHRKLSELGFFQRQTLFTVIIKKKKKSDVLPQAICGVLIAASIMMAWYLIWLR